MAMKVADSKDVRAAHRLSCASKLMSFLAAVVLPPAFSIPYLQVFDDKIKEVFFALINRSFNTGTRRKATARAAESVTPPAGRVWTVQFGRQSESGLVELGFELPVR